MHETGNTDVYSHFFLEPEPRDTMTTSRSSQGESQHRKNDKQSLNSLEAFITLKPTNLKAKIFIY